MDKKELYASVTDEIVKQIEAGAGEWRMPWRAIADAGEPVNATTGAAYRGGNHLVLGMTAAAQGWSGYWATYRQWQSVGAQVRKGERASHGVKWSVVECKRGDSDDVVTDDRGRRLVPYCFGVFAAEQVDGWTIPARPELDTPERIDGAEQFLAAIGADVRHGGNSAAYSLTGDFIRLPDLEQFTSAVDYYATSAHEHAHWTGHSSRLDRSLSGKFGSDAYAAEELIAELSAAFTCSRLGISTTPRRDHASYLASWLRVLRADCSSIFTAASKAQAASDFLAERAQARTLAEVAA
jgi:antirestriction protein ArdC